MIEINKVAALILYLFFFLSLSLGAWVFYHIKNRKKQIIPPLYELTHCEYCAFNYLAKSGSKITQCTQCRSYNSKAS